MTEKDILIRMPDEGFYSFVGPGVKVEGCPNPLEMGLFDPISAYTSALEFVIGTKYPDECMPLPRDGAHEFLHSSLSPWLPMGLYREIPEKDIEKELQLIKEGRVELRSFLLIIHRLTLYSMRVELGSGLIGISLDLTWRLIFRIIKLFWMIRLFIERTKRT